MEQNCVASVYLTYHWCTAQVWLKRTTKRTPTLNYCCTNTSESRSSPVNESLVPPRSSPPTNGETSCLRSASQWIGVMRCLHWQAGVWSESTAGQQRGTEKQTSHIRGRAGLDIFTCGGLGFDVILLTLQDGRLLGVCKKPRRASYTSVCISMCLHSVKCAQCTWKHTRKMVSKREKKKQNSTHVTEEPKITHLVVSQSHSPFFLLFIFYRGGVQTCNPTPENLSLDCQLSWKLLRSVFSLLLLLQCIVGSAVRYSKHTLLGQTLWGLQQNQRTDQLLLYIVCVNTRWEPSHAAWRRKPQSPLYCSVPNVCMCVWGSVCVYLMTIIQCGKENKTNKSSTTTNMVGRRGDLSSPVLLCNESYLEKQKREKKGSENTQMGQVTQSSFITPELS